MTNSGLDSVPLVCFFVMVVPEDRATMPMVARDVQPNKTVHPIQTIQLMKNLYLSAGGSETSGVLGFEV